MAGLKVLGWLEAEIGEGRHDTWPYGEGHPAHSALETLILNSRLGAS